MKSRRRTRNLSLLAVITMLVASLAATSSAGAAPGEIQTGWLRVETSPAVPSQMTVDGEWRNTWAVNELELPAGDHLICFSDVPGWTGPGCGYVEVVADMVHSISPEFTQRGWLQVKTNPAVPVLIAVDGNPSNNWGVFTDLPTGAHQVCFGALEGYAAPDCQTVNLTAGATSTVTGDYTADASAPGLSGAGMLRVETVPAVASQIRVDGEIADTWGLDWMQVMPGSHQVCFGDVAGFATPACQTVNVAEDATTEVTGSFVAEGYLQVSTDPGLGSQISVDGVPRDGWGIWTQVPAGPHTVCFGAVAEYPWLVTPDCEIVNVTAGSSTPVVGEWEDSSPVESGTWTELRTPSGDASWLPKAANAAGLVVGSGYWCMDPCTTSAPLSVAGNVDMTDMIYQTLGPDGAFAGYFGTIESDGTLQATDAYVWTSPTATGQKVVLPEGYSNPGVNVISPDGHLNGGGYNHEREEYMALVWTSPGATPNIVPNPPYMYSGKVEGQNWKADMTGWSYDGIYNATAVLTPNFTAVLLPGVDAGQFPGGSMGLAINDNRMIAGMGVDADLGIRTPVVWQTPTSQPIVLQLPAGTFVYSSLYFDVTDDGTVIAAGGDGTYLSYFVWTSPTAAPYVLSAPPGESLDSLLGVMSDGKIIVNAVDAYGSHVLIWDSPSAAPRRLPTPVGYSDVEAVGISTNDSLYTSATDPYGEQPMLVWADIDSSPVVAFAPTGYPSVSMNRPLDGSPIIARGQNPDGTWVGFMFHV